MATPHIEAVKEEIAKVVLMPGDPLRAKWVADNYLSEVKKINKVRNMLGYTGYYKGAKVTVMGSGMGIPSIGIYAYELFKFYEVESIIRIGTGGAYLPQLKLYDIILVTQSYSESTFAKVLSGYKGKIIKANPNLNEKIKKTAKKLKLKLYEGPIITSDVFYNEQDKKINKNIQPVAVDMESFGLFHIGNLFNKEVATLLSISNSLVTKEELSAKEREQTFKEMVTLALETIKKEEK